jgi:hydroxymethylpyrimidine pyrophosphatase-like HAD family hydrolase
MDKYLNTDTCYERLLKEYKQHNSLVVAVDFDGTLYDFHNEGITFDSVINLIKDLKKIGCYIIIFTANDNTDLIINYCVAMGIPFDTINENPPFFKSDSRKIYYNVLIDDRAGLSEVYNQLTKLTKEV